MKQIVQNSRTGILTIEELPLPVCKPEGILVKTAFSVISAGTEKTSVSTAKASLVGKARSRPDLVKQVINTVQRQGIIETYKLVKDRLDSPLQLGYSCVGEVIDVGEKVMDIKIGDRVACAGGGYATHAEINYIPNNLAVKLPDNVTYNEAVYTTLGAIAMQGVRQADVKVGDSIAVIGLGLIGQLTVQILKASGCRVICIDINDFAIEKIGGNHLWSADISLNSTKTNIVEKCLSFTDGFGVDKVIITAGTRSNEPLLQAGEILRDRGTIIVVGNVPVNIPRSPFYEKEIDIRFSRSYGPGRYDREYEEKGRDYPIGYVKWTERRNMEAFLKLVADGRIKPSHITTHNFILDNAPDAYEMIMEGSEPYLGILIQYDLQQKEKYKNVYKNPDVKGLVTESIKVGFIGAGNFAQSYLLPSLKKLKVTLGGLATITPVNAKTTAKKFGFDYYTTNPTEILNDNGTDTIFIATRHDSHSKYVIDALHSKKNVYVEKPLAVTEDELHEIASLYNQLNDKGLHTYLMVGYNRRFSKPIRDVKKYFINCNEPLVMNYRVNAGFIPRDHWYQAKEQRGRIIGEACHFIDTMQYITDAVPTEVFCQKLPDVTDRYFEDNVSITLTFSDGSIGVVTYLANGARSVRKEFLEVFGSGQTVVMDDFRKVSFYSDRKKQTVRYQGDKGHVKEMQAVVESLCSGSRAPISFESLLLTTISTLMAVSSARTGEKKLITL